MRLPFLLQTTMKCRVGPQYNVLHCTMKWNTNEEKGRMDNSCLASTPTCRRCWRHTSPPSEEEARSAAQHQGRPMSFPGGGFFFILSKRCTVEKLFYCNKLFGFCVPRLARYNVLLRALFVGLPNSLTVVSLWCGRRSRGGGNKGTFCPFMAVPGDDICPDHFL